MGSSRGSLPLLQITRPSALSTRAGCAFAARCAFDAKQYPKAAALMHEALDAQVPLDAVRTIALRIAGAAGDGQLTKRARQ